MKYHSAIEKEEIMHFLLCEWFWRVQLVRKMRDMELFILYMGYKKIEQRPKDNINQDHVFSRV